MLTQEDFLSEKAFATNEPRVFRKKLRRMFTKLRVYPHRPDRTVSVESPHKGTSAAKKNATENKVLTRSSGAGQYRDAGYLG